MQWMWALVKKLGDGDAPATDYHNGERWEGLYRGSRYYKNIRVDAGSWNSYRKDSSSQGEHRGERYNIGLLDKEGPLETKDTSANEPSKQARVLLMENRDTFALHWEHCLYSYSEKWLEHERIKAWHKARKNDDKIIFIALYWTSFKDKI